MAIIFGLSSLSDLPAPPTGVDDKTEHFLAYAGLGLLAVRATSGATFAGLTAPAAASAWALATAYGLTDEIHQRFVPGRTFDLLDWRADALGAAAATLGAWASGIIARSRRRPRAPAAFP
jgi:VanZ family protein